AGVGLPPGVDDDGLALAHRVVVPARHFGFNGFADGGHVLEPVPVFGGFVGAELAQHADGGGGGVEDVHAEAFGDAPRPARVGVGGYAFVHDAGGPEGEGAVDDVGVAGDPADVRGAPVGVGGVDVLVVLRGAGHVGQVAAGAVLAALGPAGGAGG